MSCPFCDHGIIPVEEVAADGLGNFESYTGYVTCQHCGHIELEAS
jgi:hypothetical protein